jgi:hypothetical protein
MKLPILTSANQSRLITTSLNRTLKNSLNGISMEKIEFVDGWDDADNSDVHAYTEAGATQALKDASEDLKKAIESPKCNIKVTKGCHQVGDPHFTLSENGKGCNNKTYAGTKSTHVFCV